MVFCAVLVLLLADRLRVCFTVFARFLVAHFFVDCFSTDFVRMFGVAEVFVYDVNTEVIFETFDDVSQKIRLYQH